MENSLKNRDVMITLNSVQIEGNDKSETELITKGTYNSTQDGFKITYDESEATGYDGSTTILTIKGDSLVTLQRVGTTTSNLFIEKDKKHHCCYGTPYGDFMVGITTKDIKSQLSKNGGDLYLNYVVDINASYVSEHKIYINIKV